METAGRGTSPQWPDGVGVGLRGTRCAHHRGGHQAGLNHRPNENGPHVVSRKTGENRASYTSRTLCPAAQHGTKTGSVPARCLRQFSSSQAEPGHERREKALETRRGKMALRERGKIQAGSIVFPNPLTLPEGTEVLVSIEPLAVKEQTASSDGEEDFAALPFFGMWRERQDMRDSAAWVRKERKRWQQRVVRQD